MLGVLGAGQADLLLDDLRGEGEVPGEQGRVVVRAQVVLAGEVGADRLAEGLLDGVRPLLHDDRRLGRATAAQRDPAEADRLGVPRLELVQPRLVPGRVGLRVDAVVPGVAQPQFGVLGDVLHLALHDPGVAALRHPGAEAVAPLLTVDVLPVGQEMRVPPSLSRSPAC